MLMERLGGLNIKAFILALPSILEILSQKDKCYFPQKEIEIKSHRLKYGNAIKISTGNN